MTEVVIDASVAVKWFVPEAQTEIALALQEQSILFHAPEFMKLEVASAILKYVGKAQVSPALWHFAQPELERSIDNWHLAGPLLVDAFEIARALPHPLYDCLYLALARQLNTVFITADNKLLKRLEETPYAPLAISLSNWQSALTSHHPLRQ